VGLLQVFVYRVGPESALFEAMRQHPSRYFIAHIGRAEKIVLQDTSDQLIAQIFGDTSHGILERCRATAREDHRFARLGRWLRTNRDDRPLYESRQHGLSLIARRRTDVQRQAVSDKLRVVGESQHLTVAIAACEQVAKVKWQA